MRTHTIVLTLMAVVTCAAPATAAGPAEVDHPYLLWTGKELQSMRRTIETRRWAKRAYQEMVASTDRDGEDLRLLFRHAVLQSFVGG